MARLVAIYIQDNEMADRFVEEHPGLVVGLYGVPTQYCECPKTGKDRIVRGAKLGWWVHPDCGKPNKYSWQAPKNLLSKAKQSVKDANVSFRPQWTQIIRRNS